MPRGNRRGWHVRGNVWNVSGLAHAGMVSRDRSENPSTTKETKYYEGFDLRPSFVNLRALGGLSFFAPGPHHRPTELRPSQISHRRSGEHPPPRFCQPPRPAPGPPDARAIGGNPSIGIHL